VKGLLGVPRGNGKVKDSAREERKMVRREGMEGKGVGEGRVDEGGLGIGR
jgi:hypothetical protein